MSYRVALSRRLQLGSLVVVIGAPRSMSSWWKSVEPGPKDPILGVTEAFLADQCPDKVNVGVGISSDGRSIKMVEETLKLAYGEDSQLIKDNRIAAVQALSGTGACRLFADFQKCFMPDSHIYIPFPTWSNHHNIWSDALVPERTYHYYHPETKGLDFAELTDDIKNAPNGSFFLIHACAHNPTGVDPTEEQWKEISYQFKVKGHFPFFDIAYQGFASGGPERDARSIRIFLIDGHRIGIPQSYAKNMSLYGQRVGCPSYVVIVYHRSVLIFFLYVKLKCHASSRAVIYFSFMLHYFIRNELVT